MKIIRRLQTLFRRRKIDAEMSEEMRLHLEQRVEQYIADGLSPDEARHFALRRFGGVEQVKELARDQRPGRWLEQFGQDLRYAIRALRKERSFTLVAVLTLAFGIGLNAALFAVFNAVSLRPLPVRAADELVVLRGRTDPGANRQSGGGETADGNRDPFFTYQEFLDYRANNHVFSALAAHYSGMWRFEFSSTSDTPVRRAMGILQIVSENYFRVLGAQMALGRSFSAEEADAADAHPVVVLSHRFWERDLAGDPNIVGKTVLFNRRPYTVLGVTAPEFSGHSPSPGAGWLPIGPSQRITNKFNRTPLALTGRLKPGVSVATAKADVDLIALRLAREFPRPDQKTSIELEAGLRWIYIPVNALTIAAFSPVLMGFGMVLLIACTNVTNLLLARGVTRHQEIGVRLTLGASRGRIMRQLLTENLLLCALGGLAGLVLAVWALQLFRPVVLSYLPPEWAPLTEMWEMLKFAPDWRVIACTAVLVLLAGIAAGLAPAWHASRTNLVSALKDEGSAFGRRLTHSRLRSFLVVSQVAVCLILLSGAGVLVRNLWKIRHADLGFDAREVYHVEFDMATLGALPRDVREARLLAGLETLRALPGVASTTAAHGAPLLGAPQATVQAGKGGVSVPSTYAIATAGFFETFGIALQQGRAFTALEVQGRANVAVISEALARRLWPEGNPLGQTLTLSDPDATSLGFRSRASPAGGTYEVVGIARDVAARLMEPDRAFVYLPVREGTGFSGFYLRPRDASAAALEAIMRAAARAGVPINLSRRLGTKLEEDMLPFLGAAWMSGILGGLALAMAAVGLYGVMSFSVRRRVREIGIRIALGATSRRVVALFVRQGMRLVALGAVFGLGGTCLFLLALTRFWYRGGSTEMDDRVRDAVFDPVAYIAVALLLAAVALLACWLPARRATKVDPMVALRCE